MKDSELRLLVLKKIYDARRMNFAELKPDSFDFPISSMELMRILKQLTDQGFIGPISRGAGNGLRARITVDGIDEIESQTQEASEKNSQTKSKWKVIKELSQGGQGKTFIVEDETKAVSGLYVLKQLKDRERIHRLKGEVEAGLRLKHVNIIQIVDFDLEAEEPYLISEFCENGNLTWSIIQNYSIEQKLELFHQICKGVAYAHENGVVHRDLTPKNIFLKPCGTPVVGDFGICFIENGEHHTLTSEIVGPRMFMAPELRRGKVEKVKPVSDVYVLGKLLYWLLSGDSFDREEHRESEFNLIEKIKDPAIPLIYDLLDKTICQKEESRIQNALILNESVKALIQRIQRQGHAIGLKYPQTCNYCGVGEYQKIVDADTSHRGSLTVLQNFGFNAIGSPVWLIFVCNHCGNVQIFRPEYAKDQNIWKK